MQDNSSKTALAVAYLRAAHQIFDCSPLVLDDPIALPLLGVEAEALIRSSRDKYMSPEAKALRAHVVLRSRYAEDRLRTSMSRGVTQYVILGAGFDTFSLRQPSWADGLTIIEIDHLCTQKLKQTKIQEAGISVPRNLKFLSVDFERESISEALSRAEFDHKHPVFFSWLGVTMYLTQATIAATLRSMSTSPKGSEVVLTFMQNADLESSAVQTLATRVAEIGEPFVSYYTPDSIKKELLICGFSEAHVLTPDTSADYFSDEVGTLTNPKRSSIVSAIV
jgi:methyltransferase (TIGR00027 family)